MADTFKFVQTQDFRLAGSGCTLSDTSITLQSFKQIDGSTTLTMTDFGTTGYGVIEPDTSREENISFTGVTQNADGTATLTGITRGLRFVDPYTQDTNLRHPHAGSVTFRISNTAPFYAELAGKDNDETVTGIWTYTESAMPRISAQHTYGAGEEEYLATYRAVQNASYNGTVDASTTAKGIVELATDTEALNGTSAGGTTATLIPTSNQFGSLKSTHTDYSVTYGATIVAGNILYYDSATDRYKVALATTQAHIDALAAVAYDAGSNGDTAKKVLFPGSKVTGASGLTKGGAVYLSDTGTASATTGTIRKVIGRALSATTWIFNPDVETPTETAAAYALPRAGSDSKLAAGWIPATTFSYTAGEAITANDALYLETRKYRYQTGADAVHEIQTTNWEGQTFLVDATADTAYGAQLYCYKLGAPASNYTVAIRATAAGLPTGADLATGTLTIADISVSNQYDKGAWYTVTFGTPLALTAATTYALIVYSAGNSAGVALQWTSDDSAPSFSGGSRVSSANSGSTWTADTAKDFHFRIITTPFAKKAKADDIITTLPFLGFAAASASSGASVSVYQNPNSVISGFTGLIPGRTYMLSQSTAGALSLVPLTVGTTTGIIKYVGTAKSATELEFNPKLAEDYLGYKESIVGSGASATTYCEVMDEATSVVVLGVANDNSARTDGVTNYIRMTRGMSPATFEIKVDDGASAQVISFTLTWLGQHIKITGIGHGSATMNNISLTIYQYR